MKKTLKAILATTLVLSLYGCSSKDKEEVNDKEEINETEKEEEEVKEEEKESTAAEEKKKKEEELAKKRAEESNSNQTTTDSYTEEESQVTNNGNTNNTDNNTEYDDMDTMTQTLAETEGPYADQSEALAKGSEHVNEVRIKNEARRASFTIERDSSGQWMIYYYVYK